MRSYVINKLGVKLKLFYGQLLCLKKIHNHKIGIKWLLNYFDYSLSLLNTVYIYFFKIGKDNNEGVAISTYLASTTIVFSNMRQDKKTFFFKLHYFLRQKLSKVVRIFTAEIDRLNLTLLPKCV